MKNVWTNFSHHTDTISRYFDSPTGWNIRDSRTVMLEALAPEVLDALYDTKTTWVCSNTAGRRGDRRPWPPYQE